MKTPKMHEHNKRSTSCQIRCPCLNLLGSFSQASVSLFEFVGSLFFRGLGPPCFWRRNPWIISMDILAEEGLTGRSKRSASCRTLPGSHPPTKQAKWPGGGGSSGEGGASRVAWSVWSGFPSHKNHFSEGVSDTSPCYPRSAPHSHQLRPRGKRKQYRKHK